MLPNNKKRGPSGSYTVTFFSGGSKQTTSSNEKMDTRYRQRLAQFNKNMDQFHRQKEELQSKIHNHQQVRQECIVEKIDLCLRSVFLGWIGLISKDAVKVINEKIQIIDDEIKFRVDRIANYKKEIEEIDEDIAEQNRDVRPLLEAGSFKFTFTGIEEAQEHFVRACGAS